MHRIDPDYLPETSGLVHCVLLNGEGEADGLVLNDGTEVHVPPHMGKPVLAAVRPGATVRVRGVRPRGVAMIAAVSVAPEEGDWIVDAGPPDNDTTREAERKQAHAARSPMEVELDCAEAAGEDAVIFMHTYPADLREGAERLGALLAKPHVTCVDMGHTHYNELANDGDTIFMATGSTEQIEEGPAGFSIAAVDGRGVSWRFKPLDEAWPFVLITRLVDCRLVTALTQTAPNPFVVRAKVVGDEPIEMIEMRVDDGDWVAMAPVPGASAIWQASAVHGTRLTVRARDARRRTDADHVETPWSDWTPPQHRADGSDADRVGAWPEKGIFDTQLGPNRSGRKW